MFSRQCAENPKLSPCIFEYAYFARPDSILDGVSVYRSRLEMGARLAKVVQAQYPDHDIDVVMPIPDTGRAAALQCAYGLGVPYREGFIKNRYIARTFIMPNQKQREMTVRRKLNPLNFEMQGRNILFVDDSIVRGTTSKKLVTMAREAGAKKVYFASAAPAIRHPNVYGIDMPVRKELLAHGRDETAIAKCIGADWMIYLPLDQLEASVLACVPGSGVKSVTGIDQCDLSPRLRPAATNCQNEPITRLSLSETSCGKRLSSSDSANRPGSPRLPVRELEDQPGCNFSRITQFDTSSFSGVYVTGDIDEPYFARLEKTRTDEIMMRKNSLVAKGHDVVGIHNK
jgi:adenine/guanine phosphoribosyltransferase-like PRPP-binding protein